MLRGIRSISQANIRCTDEKEVKSEQEYSDVNVLQKQMKSFVLEQSSRHLRFFEIQNKYQHKIIEKQTENQYMMIKEMKETKELPVTVKLPKFELRLFNCDKLRWTEFWDQFVQFTPI